jgi:hypothetical protein
MVRATATGAKDIDLCAPTSQCETDGLFQIRDVEAWNLVETAGGNSSSDRVINRIKVADHRVGHEPACERMPGSAIGREDEIAGL